MLLAIVYNDNPSFNLQRIISCLSTANLNMLGVDIAALSILFALFHKKHVILFFKLYNIICSNLGNDSSI